jgi:hypothetical protein
MDWNLRCSACLDESIFLGGALAVYHLRFLGLAERRKPNLATCRCQQYNDWHYVQVERCHLTLQRSERRGFGAESWCA